MMPPSRVDNSKPPTVISALDLGRDVAERFCKRHGISGSAQTLVAISSPRCWSIWGM
jgi:hypothetical protein